MESRPIRGRSLLFVQLDDKFKTINLSRQKVGAFSRSFWHLDQDFEVACYWYIYTDYFLLFGCMLTVITIFTLMSPYALSGGRPEVVRGRQLAHTG